MEIWRGAIPAPHSVLEEYLARRGIARMPASLRCRVDSPAMVAGVQRPDGKLIAVQTTRLTSYGQKLGSCPRITTGSLGLGAVRLGPAAEVIGIAEGVETALSAMQLTDMTVWASLGASRLHNLWLPDIVKEVHIFGDNDGAGQQAMRRALEAHTRLGRDVVPRSPPDSCKDYNDLLISLADRDGRDLLPEDAA